MCYFYFFSSFLSFLKVLEIESDFVVSRKHTNLKAKVRRMKKKKILVGTILAMVMLLLNLVFPYIGTTQVANAADVNLKTLNFLEKVTLHSMTGNQPTDANDISKNALNPQAGYGLYNGSTIRVSYDYKIPDGANQISTEDTYVIDIPKNILSANFSVQTLKDETGTEIGTFSINNQKIYVKFNSYFVNKQNREFNIWHTISMASGLTAGQTYPVTFDNGQTYYLKNEGNPSFGIKTHTVYKDGSVSLKQDGTFEINWRYLLSYENVMKIPAGSIIEDTMSANQKLVKDSFTFSPSTLKDSVEIIDVTDTSFKIKVVKDITKQLSIYYKTIPTDDFDKNAWQNNFSYKGTKTNGEPDTVGIGGNYKDQTIEDYNDKATASYKPAAGGGGFGNLPSFTVQKVWQQGDTPPDNIKVMVLQNGKDYREVTLTKDKGWKETITNYPVMNSTGNEAYTYTVKEIPVAGYNKEPKITGDQKTGFTITNEKIKDITVTKQWLDDIDHTAVDAIVIGKVGSTEVSSQNITLDPAKGFKVTLENLPFFKDGQEINYTVKEKNVPAGFKSDVTGNEQDGFTITNTRMMDINLKKTWIDDGSSPDSIVVEVSNGKDLPIDVTLEKKDKYEAKITVPKFGKDTAVFEHEYTVKEKNVPAGYISKVTGDATTGFVVTNTKVKDIPVEKKWVAGTENTPDTVEVTLSGASKQYDLTLEKAKGYKDSFKNIPMFENGEAIAYTLTEKPVAGYTTNIEKDNTTGGFVVTNTKVVNVPVEKKWNDKKSSHDEVKVDLYANDTKVNSPLVLNEANNYKGTFENVPKYDASNKVINYTVKEQEVTGYSAAVTGDVEEGFVITNTELTTVKAEKKWLDGESTHDDVQLDIFGVDQTNPVDTITLKDTGSTTSKALPKYDENGDVITYTVKEQTPAGYSSTITGDMEKGFIVTNTKVTNVQVKKKWLDGETTHPEINILVFASNDTKAVETVTLTAAKNYEATIENLPKYDRSGKEITYSVKEEAVEGYASAVTGNEKDGFVVTNTKQTKFDLTKVWVGTGSHPDKVEVSIINDATKEIVQTIELTKAEAFKATTDLLPAYDENGEKITYSVKETPIDHYKSTVTGDMEKGFTITNMKEVSFSVEKKWVDGKSTHDAISVELYGQDTTKPVQTVELNTANEFKATFTNMPLYTEDGKEITYTVKEKNVPAGYVSTTTGDMEKGFTITNTKQQTLNFTKVWLDGETTHPDVTLHVKGSDGSAHEVVLNEANEFKATLTVPQYDGTNKEITYTVEEQDMEGYASAITGDVENGYTVTNTKVFDLPIQKVWKDELDIHGEITVHLIGSDGTDCEIKLNEANDFHTIVQNLPKYDATNKEITYTVEEEAVENYTAAVSGDEEKGFTITNTFVKKDDTPPTNNGTTDGGTGNNNNNNNGSGTGGGTGNTTTGTGTPSSYSSSTSPTTTPSYTASNKVLPQTGMANTNIILYSGIAVMILALSMFIYTLRKRKAA